MGKRSNFERREADFYPTPRVAVVPLIPYLRAGGVKTFAEPCAGDGALVGHLEELRPALCLCGDIRAGQDASMLGQYGEADAIITNPPYTRDLMHTLIAHFQRIAPTWLLLDSDWAHTKQAAPFLPCCSDIVAIGRVKWIEGSKHTGKDNCAWYRFDVGTRLARLPRARRDDFTPSTHSESASIAARPTSRSDPVRGSVRRCAGSAPIATDLA